MKERSRVIANYLPQYHTIAENDAWWGKGFTDWVSVQNAKPLYKGHIQPKIPKGENYYALDDVDTIRWQSRLAKQYGIYGFGIYHYWFDPNMVLLTKPAELILENKDIDIHYLFLWDNTTWKRTWSNVRHANDWSPNLDGDKKKGNFTKKDNGILAELIYGQEEDWKLHFDHLLPFFKDDRYIKINDKPVFGIFQPSNDYATIKKIVRYWDRLAKQNGLAGIIVMSRDDHMHCNLEYKFRYTPLVPNTKKAYMRYKLKDLYAKQMKCIRFYDYDQCWEEIIKGSKTADKNTFLSGFVQFDDTPRRGMKGRVIRGASPEKFGRYIKQLLDISSDQEKDYVFVTAWNEWGEGAYLEPDTKNGHAYLEALKRAIES